MIYSKVERLLGHIRNRTLGKSIIWELDKWKSIYQMSPDQRRAYRLQQKWEKISGENKQIIKRVECGAKLILYPDSKLSELIFRHNFESAERQFHSHYLKAGDIYVDVGANIGLFTVIAASKVGQDGVVYAFEPADLPRNRLIKNVRLNGFGNVYVISKALSNRSRQDSIFIPLDGHDAWSSLGKPTAGQDVIEQTVQMIKWDDFAKENAVGKVAMMKLDVEGWESKVLEGASALLSSKQAPLLQVEFTDEAAQSAGSSCQHLYEALENFGYKMYRYDAQNNKLIPDALRESYPYVNLYASKNLDHDNVRLAQR